jgi:hypothetical protein
VNRIWWVCCKKERVVLKESLLTPIGIILLKQSNNYENMGENLQFAQTPIYVSLLFYGEHLQGLAQAGLRNYDLIQGHLSDFGLAAAATSFILLRPTESRLERTILTAFTPVALTLHEFFPVLSKEENIFDIRDIACYFVASIAAYVTTNISKRI